MSLDRFVRFGEGAAPTKNDVQCLLEDFFGGAAWSIVWNEDRFFVDFAARCSDALRRLGRDFYKHEPFDRTLEVWLSPTAPVISVITRHADDYVSALADGIARVVALRWGGEVEPP